MIISKYFRKAILLSVAILAFGKMSFAQINQYRYFKDDISLKDYSETNKLDKYNPWIAGGITFMLPSFLGYFYVDEPIRGGYVFAAKSAVVISGLVALARGGLIYSRNNLLAYYFLGTFFINKSIKLWSIYDVMRIAKVKNIGLYKKSKMTINLSPDFRMTPYNGTSQVPSYGLCFSLNF